jgi:hypothetical protein
VLSVVQLGTPNYGSYSPVLAFRGTHDVARKVERLDVVHGMDEYRDRLFMGFSGLYDMLPDPGKGEGVNMFDLQNWPHDGHLPRADELQRAQQFQQSLYVGDSRYFLIAGVAQDTIVGAQPGRGEFIYVKSVCGDGTVPLDCCLLPAAKTYYVAEEHGALPNNLTVCQAVCDILHTGATARLPDRWEPPLTREAPPSVSDSELRQKPIDLDVRDIDDNQKRALIDSDPKSGYSERLLSPEQERSFLEGFLSLDPRDGEN